MITTIHRGRQSTRNDCGIHCANSINALARVVKVNPALTTFGATTAPMQVPAAISRLTT